MRNPDAAAPEPKSDTSLGLKTKFKLEIIIPMLSGVAMFTLIYAKLITMENLQRKAWTIQHQIMWENQLAISNPGIKVPAAEVTVNLMNQQAQP